MRRSADATANLHSVEERLPPGHRLAHCLVAGDAAGELDRLARAAGVRMLVLGAHGRLDPSQRCRDTIVEHLLRNPPCPLLLVPHEGPHRSWAEATNGRIRLAVEIADHAPCRATLEWLSALRQRVPCDVVFVRVPRTSPGAHRPVEGSPESMPAPVPALPGEGESVLLERHATAGGADPLVWEAFVSGAHILLMGLALDGGDAPRVLAALHQSTVPILCIPDRAARAA